MSTILTRFFPRFFDKRIDALHEKLVTALCSRKGENGQKQFEKRIYTHAPAFFRQWDKLAAAKNFAILPDASAAFAGSVLDVDIVVRIFPAYRTGGIFENSFAPVAVLRALADVCLGKENARAFPQMLTESAPGHHCHWAAYAGALLDAGKYREAADAALEARRLMPYDYCCSRILNETQKALAQNGMTPDLPVSFTDNTDRFCDMPFVNLKYSTSLAGEEHISPTICFSMAWLPIAFDHDFSWNNKDMQELRQSVFDGSFKYCDECRCPHMRDGTLPRKDAITDPYLRDIIDNNKVILESGPRRLLFAYDVSCNISCPSCRPQVHMASAETTKRLDDYMDVELPPLLPDVRELVISQSGEALASRHSLRILKSLTPAKYPHLKVELFTNMTLVSASMWESLGESAGCVKKIFMSVDGATPSTLEKLRRGLKWPRLMDAMDFVRGLRLSGKLEATTLQFVVQKDNFRELRELLDLAATYHIDTVMISKIESHGSYTDGDFRTLNVGDPANSLFGEYTAAIESAEKYHARMLSDKERLASGAKPVPAIIWRLF